MIGRYGMFDSAAVFEDDLDFHGRKHINMVHLVPEGIEIEIRGAHRFGNDRVKHAVPHEKPRTICLLVAALPETFTR